MERLMDNLTDDRIVEFWKQEDGWSEGSWDGFNENYSMPTPWYFRTIATWKAPFETNGFILKKIIVPVNPLTKAAASIVFIGNYRC
jgi:hypothetical protein